MSVKRKLILTELAVCAAALLFSSCVFVNGNWDPDSGYNYSYFEYDLRGTWERDDFYRPPGGLPETVKGQIVIDYNTIKVIGGATITHLAGVAKNVALDGYSSGGKIYIKQGTWQSPASYYLWNAPGGIQMLTLTGGSSSSSADENFIRIGAP